MSLFVSWVLVLFYFHRSVQSYNKLFTEQVRELKEASNKAHSALLKLFSKIGSELVIIR